MPCSRIFLGDSNRFYEELFPSLQEAFDYAVMNIIEDRFFILEGHEVIVDVDRTKETIIGKGMQS